MAMPVRQKAKVVTQIKTASTPGGDDHHHETPLIKRKVKTGNKRPMRWRSLHHHSTFSYLDGYQLPEAHVRRAEELQMDAMAMTEHGNVDSHSKFGAACEDSGVKPIFGCEIYMPVSSEDHEWDEPDAKTQRKHHLTIIAKDDEGYHNLLLLVTKSWKNFYHEPTVTWDDLVAHKKGLVILSGCQGSLLFCSTVGGKGIEEADASFKRGLAVARRFARTFDDYYIEVQAFPELKKTCQFNKLAPKLAAKVGAKLVATMDCHYTMLEEQEIQKILHNLRPGNRQTIEEQAREWGYAAPLCPPVNDGTIFRKLVNTGLTKDEAMEAIVSTEEIAQGCTATLPRLPMVRFPLPEGYDEPLEYWRDLLREGWEFRGFDKLPMVERKAAKAQLKHEMALIESKDFVDYFLLVAAGVKHIKDLNIPVGPARGSAAASLVAYLLQITEVNPMKFPLLKFERFIDVTREDLPDIDLDFPGEARPILRKFYLDMFGEGCVNNVGTFTYFKNKLAVDDVGRVFHVPKPDIERLKSFLIERSSGDMRASSTIEDTAAQFEEAREVFEKYPDLKKSQWIEGNVKGFGVHAAALVLSNEPITSVTAVAEREVPKGSGNIVQVVALDKYDAERQGLVKMDFLGLNTMSMLWECQKRLGWDIADLYGIPLDDPKVYAAFQEVDVVGVFQFEGRAMRYVCGALKPEKFSEIMDCNALARPGPLHNGAVREYADQKHSGKIAKALHPAIENITAVTQHQIVYQEQILQICREIGDFGWTQVADIRRIISRKKGEQEFNRKRDEFLAGVRTVHERLDYEPMSDEIGLQIWGSLITSGAYAFNAAHCASYGLIAYWTMYIKVYYPDVFYAACLRESAKDGDRTRQLLRDADKHGVRVLMPSIKRSGANWEPVKGKKIPTIRAGFQQIDGIGEKTAARVLEFAQAENPEGWSALQALKGFGPKTIEKIERWVNDEDPFNAFMLNKNIEKIDAILRAGELTGANGKPLPIPTHKAADLGSDEAQGKTLQVFWLGTFVQRNIRDLFEANRAKGHDLDPAKVKDSHLSEWAMLTGEDDTDQLLIKVDRWRYPAMKKALFDFRMGRDLLLIRGVKPARTSTRSLSVKQLWVIDPDD